MAERSDAELSAGSWLADATFVDSTGGVVPPSKVASNQLIGLYFSASWCPPCQKFLPKLIMFYKYMKELGNPFEIVYVSSDHTEEDMQKYMQEKEVPWVAVKFNHPAAERLRRQFGIEAVPAFPIVTLAGEQVETNAKKDVDAASTSSSTSVNLFNSWKEKIPKTMAGDMSHDAKMECKCGKVPCDCKMGAEAQCKCGKVPCQCKMGAEAQCKCGKVPCQCKMGAEAQCKCGKVPCQCKMGAEAQCKCGKVPCQCKMGAEAQCKCGKVPCQCRGDDTHLYAPESLEELKRENEVLKMHLAELAARFKISLPKEFGLIVYQQMNGYLLKQEMKRFRGIVWKRWYFCVEQGNNRLAYYRTDGSSPQGYIEMDKVTGVSEVPREQQDKNHATFQVQCEGMIYQLQAQNEAEMRKWIAALHTMSNMSSGASP
ncbi:hypothetical protein EMCRGX_G022482 [Ephydatia muelleri]|eukprot:Em0009g1230a